VQYFDILKKRRMIRQFKKEPLSDDILNKLIYAGLRAPTGSNLPYRKLMVVKDPRIIRLMHYIAPGYMEGDPSAMIIVYTDLSVALSNGNKAHGYWYSRVDAGAAAENIHLAAVDLGIGSAFFTSMSAEGLRVLLGMPEYCRPEIVVRLGHPGANLAKPKKALPEANVVYLDKFGVEWEKDGKS